MKGYLILPLTKGPHSGRIGDEKLQDWWRGLVKAKNLMEKFPSSKILVLSAVHIAGEKAEAKIYLETLHRMGVGDDKIMFLEKAQETMEQVEIAKKIAAWEKMELLVVSTFLHYPRVRWLFRGFRVRHYGVFGIPHPREAITDIILIVLFPIIDLLGKREWFRTKIVGRRESGKH